MSRPSLPYRRLATDDDNTTKLPVSAHLDKIRKALKHIPVDDTNTVKWLDTGFPTLNAVLGSEKHGVPFGRIYEISGEQSHGKSALAMELAGVAQKQHGAVVTLYDAETTFDPDWAGARGLDIEENFHLLQPYMVGDDEDRTILDSARLFHQLEDLVKVLFQEDKNRPQVLIVDSIASLMAPEEGEKHLEDQTMRENTALSRFLSKLFRRWAPLARSHNVMMLCINQLREKPGFAFGDPKYTPGGKALPFYSTVRVRMARVKGGKIPQNGRIIGAKGVITNTKNKAGRGSVEGAKCGFKIFFTLTGKPSQYMEADKIKRDS